MTENLPQTPALAEDLLLLLFDPTSGTFAGEGMALFHVLAGAVLVDLALRGNVEIDPKQRVHAVTDQDPDDELLARAWQRITRKPVEVHTLIAEIGPPLREATVERVVARGDIHRERGRTLGFIPTTKLTSATPRRDELLRPVRAALVDGAEPDARTGALAALLFASGSLPALHREIPWGSAVYRRGQEMQNGEWGAAAAGEAVRRTVAGIATSTIFVGTVVQPNS